MTVSFLPSVKTTFFDTDGLPLDSGKVFTYLAGTLTPIDSYSDATGSTENDNPVILDERGQCNLYLTDGIPYKLIIKTSANVQVELRDDVSATSGGAVSDAFVPVAGATMTGPLILFGNPTVDLGAATKQYVDSLQYFSWIHEPTYDYTNLTIQNATSGHMVKVQSGVTTLILPFVSSSIEFTPVTGIASTDLQAAIVEVDAKIIPVKYIVKTFIKGTPTANATVFSYIFNASVTMTNASLSNAYSSTASAGTTTDFLIKKNGTTFSTAQFTSGVNAGSFVSGTFPTTFAIGDILTIVVGAAVDASIANISISLGMIDD